jgi:hypothetical protein
MKKFLITEDEKSRILGMHRSAIAREFLGEQGTPAAQPATQPAQPATQPATPAPAAGTPAQPATQPNPTLDRLNQLMGTSLPKNARNEDVINAYKTYLGTDINGMVGKTIVVFNDAAKQANPSILGSTIQSEFIIGSIYFNGTNTFWVWKTPIKTNFNESDKDMGYTVRTGEFENAAWKGVSLFTINKEKIIEYDLGKVKQTLYPSNGTFGMVAKDQTPFSKWVDKGQNTPRRSFLDTGFFTITPFIAGQGAQLSSNITTIAETPATPTKP